MPGAHPTYTTLQCTQCSDVLPCIACSAVYWNVLVAPPGAGTYLAKIDLIVQYITGERREFSLCEAGTTDLEGGTISW